MEKKERQPLNIFVLALSPLPFASLVPVLMNLKLTLPGNVRYIWAGINIVCAPLGLVTGTLCVKRPESRSPLNVIAVVVSLLLVLSMAGVFQPLSDRAATELVVNRKRQQEKAGVL